MTGKNLENIDVSIIVPLFHGTGYVDGILHMAKKNAEVAERIKIELIFVNDSPDDVLEYSETWNMDFPVIVVSNKENLGIQRARLCGVDHSHGSFLLFLDQDDVIFEDTVNRLYDIAQNTDIAVSDWSVEIPRKYEITTVDRLAHTEKFSINRLSYRGNIIGPPCHCLIRRDCLPVCWKNRIMKINGADDYLLWMGMLAEGRRFSRCKGILYIHKYHETSFSNDELNLLRSEDEAFKLAADEYQISSFWQWIHARSVRQRIRLIENARTKKSLLLKWILMLLYPERLPLYIMNKCGKLLSEKKEGA